MTISHFVDELRWRGLLQDISDEAGIRKLGPDTVFYVGFDPTAPSLQIGNLIPLLVSLHLGRAGLKPLLLFGGATGAIGDPSGKNAERQLLPRETIDRNVATQEKQVAAMFARLGVKPTFVNNYDWIKNVSVLEFLRDIGKHLTVNYMLSKDVVKTRLDGDGISFTEFSYMLLQGFDFLHLYQNKSCKMQIGGSDQWGNITAGLELIRKKIQGDAYALSWPLLTNAQGKKFGKSESGTYWLDPSMTSPFKFHQFWLNVEDADAVRLLKIFTFLTKEEIDAVAASAQSAPEKRECQKLLADTVTTLVHGEAATNEAKQSASVLFGGSWDGITEAQLEEIFADVPSTVLPLEKLKSISFLDLLAETKVVKSKGEGRRLISNGGAYLNNERISDEGRAPLDAALSRSKLLVLRTGKKNYHLVKTA